MQDTHSFDLFDLKPEIKTAISRAGYTKPTPIQMRAIPEVLAGKDVLGLAQTGTGKTAAFALPIIQKLMADRRRALRAVVICPTRELADQIYESVRNLSRGSGLNITTLYGAVSFASQAEKLRSGTDIVVACPGRLLDHIRQRTIDLSKVNTLVLDEADHMFDIGFLPVIKSIVKVLPRQRQTLLFSATMPGEIQKLALEVMSNPVVVRADSGGLVETVSHALYPVSQDSKSALTLELLKDMTSGSVLIFARTKSRARGLALKIQDAGFSSTCLQGNLSQGQRQRAIRGFRDGRFKIMVATDIAARGIDISSVSHVINFDMPDTVEAYTHRIGRTGRAARSGTAITLMTVHDGRMVHSIERARGEKIERVSHGKYAADVKAGESQDRMRGGRKHNRRRDRKQPAAGGGRGSRPYRDRSEQKNFSANPEGNRRFRHRRPRPGADRQPAR